MRLITSFTAALIVVAPQWARTEPITPVVHWCAAVKDAAKLKAKHDLATEPNVQKPLDPKLLAKLGDQLKSKDYQERTAALAALAKLLAAKKDAEADYRPLIEPLFSLAGWGGIARNNARRNNARLAEDLLVHIGRQATPLLWQRLKSADVSANGVVSGMATTSTVLPRFAPFRRPRCRGQPPRLRFSALGPALHRSFFTLSMHKVGSGSYDRFRMIDFTSNFPYP